MICIPARFSIHEELKLALEAVLNMLQILNLSVVPVSGTNWDVQMLDISVALTEDPEIAM